MKLLLDQGLPRSAVTELAVLGYNAVHVGDSGMAMASDETIIRRALDENRVVVTLDADCHSIIAVTGATAPSVVRIRIEGLRGRETALLLDEVIRAVGDRMAGALVSVDLNRVRVRSLPIRGDE